MFTEAKDDATQRSLEDDSIDMRIDTWTEMREKYGGVRPYILNVLTAFHNGEISELELAMHLDVIPEDYELFIAPIGCAKLLVAFFEDGVLVRGHMPRRNSGEIRHTHHIYPKPWYKVDRNSEWTVDKATGSIVIVNGQGEPDRASQEALCLTFDRQGYPKFDLSVRQAGTGLMLASAEYCFAPV
jgi:hypothetical protein